MRRSIQRVQMENSPPPCPLSTKVLASAGRRIQCWLQPGRHKGSSPGSEADLVVRFSGPPWRKRDKSPSSATLQSWIKRSGLTMSSDASPSIGSSFPNHIEQWDNSPNSSQPISKDHPLKARRSNPTTLPKRSPNTPPTHHTTHPHIPPTQHDFLRAASVDFPLLDRPHMAISGKRARGSCDSWSAAAQSFMRGLILGLAAALWCGWVMIGCS